MGIPEQIGIARGILAGQGNCCAECGEPLRFEDATKRSHSFDVICWPCYKQARKPTFVVLDEAADWKPPVLHVIKRGKALCRFSDEVVTSWPEGHAWTDLHPDAVFDEKYLRPGQQLCEECRRLQRERVI